VVSRQFWGNVDYPMLMIFAGKLVYTKVVDNSFIYLLLKFSGIWLCGLGVIAV
jgi:hypothetical protein